MVSILPPSLTYFIVNARGRETCTAEQRHGLAVQARLAEAEDARSAAEAQAAATREEARQSLAAIHAEAQAAAARARKEADAEIGAAHTEGAAAAVRARQEADSAIAEVRAGAEAAAARAKQEADSSAALIRWADTQAGQKEGMLPPEFSEVVCVQLAGCCAVSAD